MKKRKKWATVLVILTVLPMGVFGIKCYNDFIEDRDVSPSQVVDCTDAVHSCEKDTLDAPYSAHYKCALPTDGAMDACAKSKLDGIDLTICFCSDGDYCNGVAAIDSSIHSKTAMLAAAVAATLSHLFTPL